MKILWKKCLIIIVSVKVPTRFSKVAHNKNLNHLNNFLRELQIKSETSWKKLKIVSKKVVIIINNNKTYNNNTINL